MLISEASCPNTGIWLVLSRIASIDRAAMSISAVVEAPPGRAAVVAASLATSAETVGSKGVLIPLVMELATVCNANANKGHDSLATM